MAYETYRVRRRFQWNGFVYAPPGQCECSSNPGYMTPTQDAAITNSTNQAEQYNLPDAPLRNSNPCIDVRVCKGLTGTGCTCGDAGYCGQSVGKGACGIKPHMYGGDIWLARDGDPKIEHILARRFVIYDSSLPTAESLLKDNPKIYRTLVEGQPKEGVLLFESSGQIIVAPEGLKEPVETPA